MRRAALPLIFLATTASAQEPPVLTVLTYDSFTAEWGPGPAVEAAFEATCGCDLRFATGGDGAALLAQLLLEGASTEVDVVLGLDATLMAQAEASGLLAPHGLGAEALAALDLPVPWADDTFVPFDWGWFAFVGREGGPAPASFRELAEGPATILIQDPRSSTPGLGLVTWVRAAHGDEAPAIWEALADNVVTVTPGWSEAYGLFTEGEADLVLSYTTSPAYHLIAEGDASFRALAFEEGNYLQVEVAARVAGAAEGDLAGDFLAFVLTDGFQAAIPEGNWMYPAVTPEGGLPEGFDAHRPARTLYLDPAEAAAIREAAVEEWRAALSR